MDISKLGQCNDIENGCPDGFDWAALQGYNSVEDVYNNLNNVDWWTWGLSSIGYDISDLVVYAVQSLPKPSAKQLIACGLCVQEPDLSNKGRQIAFAFDGLESQEICDYFRSQVSLQTIESLIQTKLNENEA